MIQLFNQSEDTETALRAECARKGLTVEKTYTPRDPFPQFHVTNPANGRKVMLHEDYIERDAEYLRTSLATLFVPPQKPEPAEQNFANHPRSIGELRADKTQMANAWTPRDALIDVLRGIDSGEITLDALVIVGRRTHEDGSIKIERRVCSPDAIVAVGLLNRAAFEIQHSNAHDD